MRCFTLLILILTLVACGSGSQQSAPVEPSKPTPPPGPKTIADVWQASQQGKSTKKGYSVLDYSQSGYLGEPLSEQLTAMSDDNFGLLTDANCPEQGVIFDFTDLPVFLANCYGIVPDDQLDDGKSVMTALAHIKSQNGGVLYFPAGQYDFRNQDNLKGIEIDFSDIFLIGQQVAGQNAARFHLHSTYSKYSQSDWGDYNIFRFISDQPRELLQDLHTSVKQGERSLTVEASALEQIAVGDMVSISFYNLDNDDVLSRDLISPLTPDSSWSSFARKEPFRWASKITAIDAENRSIVFMHRFPVSVSLETEKQLFLEHPISNVGMFNIDFTSAWTGEYCHHGMCGGLTPREIFDMDYGWSAFQVRDVVDSQFDNLSFESFTFPVETSHTLNVTISNATFKGIPGHQGIIFRGWYNVLKHSVFDYDEDYAFSPDVEAPIRPTHALTTNGFSVGNVFFDAKPLSDTVITIDFHGREPATKNLYDSITHAFIDSKGPIHEMPHSGQENVFWNIQTMDSAMSRTENQFVYSWMADKFYDISYGYKFHPRSIFVNISNPGESHVWFGGFEDEVSTNLVHIEGVNTDSLLKPYSLYCEQVPQGSTDVCQFDEQE